MLIDLANATRSIESPEKVEPAARERARRMASPFSGVQVNRAPTAKLTAPPNA
jgi:hypothetical protein